MKERIKQVKYCDNSSILIISPEGKLIRLYVPFTVCCIYSIANIQLGKLVFVEKVFSNDSDQIIYLILDQYFFYHSFQILTMKYGNNNI